jgi:hypothetical protein
MKPVDMQFMETGKEGATPGDCFRCCVASLLELPIEDVPHFCDLPDPSVHWITRTQDWLYGRGLYYLQVNTIPHGWLLKKRPLIVIAGGKSPRGNWGHCVVGELKRWDSFKMTHDPHPSRAGIVGEPEDFGLFVKLFLGEPVPTVPCEVTE